MKLPTALIAFAFALAAATPAAAYESMLSVRESEEGDQPQRRLGGWFDEDYYKKVYCRCCEWITECDAVSGVTSEDSCRCPVRDSPKTGWFSSQTYEEKFDGSCKSSLKRKAGFN